MLLHKCSSLLDCQFSDKGSETYFKIQAPLVPVIIICKMKRRAAPLGNRGGGAGIKPWKLRLREFHHCLHSDSSGVGNGGGVKPPLAYEKISYIKLVCLVISSILPGNVFK